MFIAAATTELMFNVSDAYDEYWVKTGQLHRVLVEYAPCGPGAVLPLSLHFLTLYSLLYLI